MMLVVAGTVGHVDGSGSTAALKYPWGIGYINWNVYTFERECFRQIGCQSG